MECEGGLALACEDLRKFLWGNYIKLISEGGVSQAKGLDGDKQREHIWKEQ